MSAQGRMPHAAHVAEAERAGAGLSGRRHAGRSDSRGPVRRPLCDLTRLRSGIAVFSPFSPQKPGAHRQSQKFGHNDGEPDAVRPMRAGSTRTTAVWSTSVRRNEITAETKPSFSAVKKPELKMLKPVSRNESEYKRKPRQVIASSAAS